MLSDIEKKEIDHEVEKFEYKQGACIEALMIVQHHRGWVSDDAVKDIAAYLGMSSAELDSVATFYNLIYRKPVGKNVLRICDSVSCWIMGYDRVLAKIKEQLGVELGQTTKDGAFTVLPAQCLGTCDHAPAMMINNDTYSDLDVDNVVKIIKEHQARTQSHGTPAYA